MTSTQFASIARARVILASCTSKRATFGRKSALVTGTATGNKLSYWTSGTTKFSDHTGVTPDLSNVAYDSLIEYPFYKGKRQIIGPFVAMVLDGNATTRLIRLARTTDSLPCIKYGSRKNNS